jgi:lipid A 3-O-deacylase
LSKRWLATLLGVVTLGGVARAQAGPEVTPVGAEANRHALVLGALFQGGFGVTEDRGSFQFLLAGVHAGKVLTPEMGHGLLKGNFEYGIELFPYWQSNTPKLQRAQCYATSAPGTFFVASGLYCTPLYTVGGTFHGASITPIILRWNLTHGQRWMPWVQGAGGLIWTNHKYPPFGSPILNLNNDGPDTDTSVWNFTPQFGVGAHYFVKPHRSLDFSANAVHISSASLGDKNPGVNASVQFALGYSWWK